VPWKTTEHTRGEHHLLGSAVSRIAKEDPGN